MRGLANFKRGRFKKAVEDLQSAQKLDPRTGDELLIVEAHLALGDYGAAEAAALAHKAPNEQNSAYFVLLGRARLGQEKNSEALSDFERAAKLEPENQQAQFHLGLLLMEKGDFGQAESHLTKALALQPNHARAFWLRAMAREKLQQPDAAESDRTTAQELDPTFRFADSAMGRNLLRSVVEENRQLQIESVDADGSP
jgi:Flp pilus assembly protein TadD